MNFAHIHLLLNHIPLIGLPVAALFLGYGLWTQNQPMQKFSLFVVACLALMVLPIFFTGEPAEDLVENLPGVRENFIESHEGAAKFSLVITLLAGIFAIAAIGFSKNNFSRRINIGTLVVCLIATMSLGYTANLGGKIRHTELRDNAALEAGEDGD